MDFRMPEYRDAKVEDYELCQDGVVARKDRWETAVRSIRHLVGLDAREFEISDVIEEVRKLAAERESWLILSELEAEDFPDDGTIVSIRLHDGCLLRGACYHNAHCWTWKGSCYNAAVVEAWRLEPVEHPLRAAAS